MPVILHFGRGKCATLIDVDDDDEKEISIFGLRDLYEALDGVITTCWLNLEVVKRSNGRGYPFNGKAWAAFVRGCADGIGGMMRVGNRRVNVVNLTRRGWWLKDGEAAGGNGTGVLPIDTA